MPYALYSEKTNSILTVKTIADLKSQTLHNNGDLVYVKGYGMKVMAVVVILFIIRHWRLMKMMELL